MIIFTRTAGIAPGKTGPALAFAHEVAAHFKNAHDVQLEVLRPIGGNPARVAWTTRYKSLAAMETLNAKLADDKAYQAMLDKHSGDFVGGSMHDAIWMA